MSVLTVGDVTIELADFSSLSDSDIRALNVFENIMWAEAHPEDPPRPLELTDAEARNIPDYIRFREYWGRDADGSIGAVSYGYWMDVEENRHLLRTGVEVRPDLRRRGIAKSMLRLLLDVSDAESRPRLTVTTSDRIPAGEVLARKMEAEPAMWMHVNRLLISDVDRQLIEQWIDEGPSRAPDYSLFAIDGVYPDELIDEIADLNGVMNTAPRDNLDVEDQPVTAQQIREAEKSFAASKTDRWTLFARHDQTGNLAGYTEVWWTPNRPKTVSQGDTGVRPEHRGHALGKWLKAVMLKRILDERAGVEDIRTGNADSNAPMLGINHKLGFKPFEAMTQWQVGADRVRAYLGSERA